MHGTLFVLLLACASLVAADLPVHCIRSDVLGDWVFKVSDQSFDKTVSCKSFDATSDLALTLSLPNVVSDKDGNKGTWTMIYDEGMEIRINNNRYFAFFQFKRPDYDHSSVHRSFCGMTLLSQGGSFHDNKGEKWGCFHGTKTANSDAVSYISDDGKKNWESCKDSQSSDCTAKFGDTLVETHEEDEAHDFVVHQVHDASSIPDQVLSPVPLKKLVSSPEEEDDLEEKDSASRDEDEEEEKGVAADDAMLDADLNSDSDDNKEDEDPMDALDIDSDLQTSSEDIYQREDNLVDLINLSQSSYKAKLYPQFDGKKISDLIKMAGGVSFKQVAEDHKAAAAAERVPNISDLEFGEYDENFDAGLPRSWDWRNVSGENYLFEPINQGMCGSCFAVATTDMIQTRVRILSKNKVQRKLSPQDILSCGSRYAQGCKGGFPYLASKFAQDYGLTSEKCLKYRGETGDCPTDRTCYEEDKIYVKKYNYVGGYYGACSARGMMEEIMKNGPVAIGFEASMSMMHYSSGVFLQMEDVDSTAKNFFEPTNHAVLAIGWGVDDESGKKYWIAKNSWGPDWGEQGYFRIERGKDTAHFESMAVTAIPVVPDSLLE